MSNRAARQRNSNDTSINPVIRLGNYEILIRLLTVSVLYFRENGSLIEDFNS